MSQIMRILAALGTEMTGKEREEAGVKGEAKVKIEPVEGGDTEESQEPLAAVAVKEEEVGGQAKGIASGGGGKWKKKGGNGR